MTTDPDSTTPVRSGPPDAPRRQGSVSLVPRTTTRLGIAAVAVALLAIAVIGGLLLRPSSPAHSELSPSVEVAVILCVNGLQTNPACKQSEPIQAQKDAIRDRLNMLPNHPKVRFVSHQQAYQEYLQDFPATPGSSTEQDNLSPEQLSESFRLPYTGPEELARIKAAVAGLGGVDSVIVRYIHHTPKPSQA